MAVTTDLTDFHTIETTPTTFEFTNYVTGGAPVVDTDFPIQGIQHLSAQATKTGVSSIGVDFGSNPTWTSGWSFLVWGVFLPAGAVNTDANGGLRVLIGSATTAFNAWNVGGRDFGRYPYGGWQNFAVDPETTVSSTVGTPTAGQYRYVGLGIDVTAAISKGNPSGVDAIRFGRCELRVNGTETFATMAAANDASAARWGLLQQEAGSYLWKGLMTLGHTTAITMTDSNKSIVIDNTRKVTAVFNRIEIRQAGSTISWTGISITALGTVSRGQFEVIDNASVTLDTCTFTDMSTFKFLSSTSIIDSTFRRCDQITPASATITGTTVEASTATSAIIINSAAEMSTITNSTFLDNNTAIKITAAGTYAFDGLLFSGNTFDVENSSTGAVIINATNGTNVSTFTNTNGGSVTINNAKTFRITNIVEGTEIRIFRQSDLVELAGAETVGAIPAGLSNVTVDADPDNAGRYRVTYSYNYTVDVPVFVVAMSLAYQWLRTSATLVATNSSLQIVQLIDRQYENL